MSMSPILDPLAGDPLAERLTRLALDIPPVPRLLPAPAGPLRRPAARRRRTRRSLLLAGLALAVCLGLTAEAFPSIPYQALEAAGLSTRQVVAVDGQAYDGPTRIVVSGAYADPVVTTVFAEVDGWVQPGGRSVDDVPIYLTDQFGQRYRIIGGLGVGVGAYPIFFEPLRGPAAGGGAELTLHLRYISSRNWRYVLRPNSVQPMAVASSNAQASDLTVRLSGALKPASARSLPVPAPVVGPGNVTLQVVALRSTGAYREVHTRLSGDLTKVLRHPGGSGKEWPGVFLVDSSGRYLIPVLVEAVEPIGDQVQDETRVFAAPPGTYRVVIAHPSPRDKRPGSPGTVVLAEWTVTFR
jgi:hypothetical protein